MDEVDANDAEVMLRRMRSQMSSGNYRVSQHAQQQMVEEDVTLDDVEEAVAGGQILENYPHHRRGACCLLGGSTSRGRPLHIVCTTGLPISIIITVYEPRSPKWVTRGQRRQ